MISADQLELIDGGSVAPLALHCTEHARRKFGGVTLELRSDRAELIDRFRRYYPSHETTDTPDFIYYAASGESDYFFWCAHAPTYRWSGALSADAHMFLTDATLIAALIEFDSELSSMHAAAVECNGIAAAIAGNSTAGKTTTLLACARSGLRVYSDERALLRETHVQPFLRTCSVREDGAQRLLADCEHDRLSFFLRMPGRLSIPECFGPAAVAPICRLGALFVIDGYADEPDAERITPFEALPAVALWFHTRGDRLRRTAKALSLLTEVSCYRLTLGTPAASAALITRLLLSMSNASTCLR